MENQDVELEDILSGLEQRISVYERKRKDLQKKREQLGEEIATVEKYLELAKTLYRLEADKAKLANLSSQIASHEKGNVSASDIDVAAKSRETMGSSGAATSPCPMVARRTCHNMRNCRTSGSANRMSSVSSVSLSSLSSL